MAERIAVAASGGRDSTALLHATARAARQAGLVVHALHVHHGLMPEADRWWNHVRLQCERWAKRGLPVRFCGRRLQAHPAHGESVEAWARRERYAALADMAREAGITLVLLGHHRQDQAETVLLQGLRGAGAAGLSGMPQQVQRHGIVWARPWLHMPAQAVAAYARRHRLSFVTDPSNQDPRFARSRLRHQVWPVFEQHFAQADVALAGVSRRMQEAHACLMELAEHDAQAGAIVQGRLMLAAWLALSAARRANVLRFWAQGWSTAGMPESLLGRLMGELPGSRTGARWPAPGGSLRRDRSALAFVPDTA